MSQAIMAQKQKTLAEAAQANPEHRFTNLYSLMHWDYWIRTAMDTVLARPGSTTAGVDGKSRDYFKDHYEETVQLLVTGLRKKTYEPQPVKRVHIPKSNGKLRPLGISALRDRFVQEALRAILDPIFEADFCLHSYGFRKGRCTMDAIAVMMPLFNTSNKHYYVIEGDIRSYFDTVQHRKLLSLVKRRIADKDIIDLIWKFLKAGVMEGQLFAKTEQGVPQGAIISPLLSNIYLHELDRWAEAKWDLPRSHRQKRRAAGTGNYKMVRYCDDFVVVSNGTLAEAKAVKEELKDFLRTALHLELSEEKTTITHINEGIDFLGFHIQRVNPEGKWVVHLRPTEKSTERIKKKVKDLTTRGWTWLDEYIQLTRLNALARGWAEYYKHTSLLEDIEAVTRYVWFRYLQWLMRKQKGARKHQLITTKTKVIHNRTRWTATIQEEGVTLDTYQWLPTRTELKRQRYPQKGKAGFKHPYIWEAEPGETDYPQGETGPAEHLYTDTIGARSREKEPLKMSEIKLRVKIRDHFTCQRCGHTGNSRQLQVHHRKGLTSHRMQNLETLCQRCHQSITSQQKAS